MPPSRHSLHAGFSMVELLLSIAVIAILVDIVILAINPAHQIAKAYNVKRKLDIETIQNGFMQYALDHGGTIQSVPSPPVADCAIPLAPAPPRRLCTGDMTPVTCDFGEPNDGQGCVNASHIVPLYMKEMPADPDDATGGNDDFQVDYTIQFYRQGKVVTYAPRTQIPPATEMITLER